MIANERFRVASSLLLKTTDAEVEVSRLYMSYF